MYEWLKFEKQRRLKYDSNVMRIPPDQYNSTNPEDLFSRDPAYVIIALIARQPTVANKGILL